MPDFSANAGGSFSLASGLMSHSLVMLRWAIIHQTGESVHNCAGKPPGEIRLTLLVYFLELRRRAPVSCTAILAARQRTILAGNQFGKTAGLFHVACQAHHGEQGFFRPQHA